VIPMRLSEVAAVVGGELHGDDVQVTADAVVDSRAATPGALFVAVAGEHVDGHDFAAAAADNGAVGVLGSRATMLPTVVVCDVVAALGRLARHVRDAVPDLTVLAMTGSQGKTGTKDFLAQLLEAAGPTVATAGNYNNEIGVPLTVLRATPETRYLVVEMGARGIGHIGYLCEIARPDVAAVLNVGTAHLGEFGSREAIAQAKGEIVEGLPADGVAVLNADDELVAAMAPRTQARLSRFGTDPDADVRFTDVELDDLGRPSASFAVPAGPGATVERVEARVALQELGAHQLLNAAAAAAMALAAGVPPTTVLMTLEQARSLSPWRMELREGRVDGGGIAVINDAYNANPASMRAALDTLGAIRERSGRRAIAVLGEMKELGEGAAADHADVGEHAARVGVDVLLAVGEAAAAMVEGAKRITSWSGDAVSVEDRAAALAWLRVNTTAGDVVLVKASRGAALEHVARGLVANDTEDGKTD
jgi:UDP-N-acetylmuramoyl-tripeptide--D-alanyl-D-alanine ligase